MDSLFAGRPREAVPPTDAAFKWLKSSYRRHGAWHQWIVSMQKIDAALLLCCLARPSTDATVATLFLLGALMMFAAAEKLVAAIGIGFDCWHELSSDVVGENPNKKLAEKLFEQRRHLWIVWTIGQILMCISILPFFGAFLSVYPPMHSVFIVSLIAFALREGIFTPGVFD